MVMWFSSCGAVHRISICWSDINQVNQLIEKVSVMYVILETWRREKARYAPMPQLWITSKIPSHAWLLRDTLLCKAILIDNSINSLRLLFWHLYIYLCISAKACTLVFSFTSNTICMCALTKCNNKAADSANWMHI